jgi:hypothetical protein
MLQWLSQETQGNRKIVCTNCQTNQICTETANNVAHERGSSTHSCIVQMQQLVDTTSALLMNIKQSAAHTRSLNTKERGSVVVKALCYKPESHVLETRDECIFFQFT